MSQTKGRWRSRIHRRGAATVDQTRALPSLTMGSSGTPRGVVAHTMSPQGNMLDLRLDVALARVIDAAGVQLLHLPSYMRTTRGFDGQRTLGSRRFEEKT